MSVCQYNIEFFNKNLDELKTSESMINNGLEKLKACFSVIDEALPYSDINNLTSKIQEMIYVRFDVPLYELPSLINHLSHCLMVRKEELMITFRADLGFYYRNIDELQTSESLITTGFKKLQTCIDDIDKSITRKDINDLTTKIRKGFTDRFDSPFHELFFTTSCLFNLLSLMKEDLMLLEDAISSLLSKDL